MIINVTATKATLVFIRYVQSNDFILSALCRLPYKKCHPSPASRASQVQMALPTPTKEHSHQPLVYAGGPAATPRSDPS